MKSTKSRATPLQPCDAEALQQDMQEIQLAISRRAYELFESRNREHGHDSEDWFQAEAELLRPVSVAISESAGGFSIRANLAGFSGKELKVSIEPARIAIVGRKDAGQAAEAEAAPSADPRLDLILRLIPLSSEIDPEAAVVELQAGVLRFELPKAAKAEAAAAGAA